MRLPSKTAALPPSRRRPRIKANQRAALLAAVASGRGAIQELERTLLGAPTADRPASARRKVRTVLSAADWRALAADLNRAADRLEHCGGAPATVRSLLIDATGALASAEAALDRRIQRRQAQQRARSSR